jgi:uncharacterized protein
MGGFMSVDMQVLRDLHRMLRQIADIQSQLDRGPRQVKAAQMQVDACNQAVDQCRNSIRQKKMEADRKQLQMREREAKLRDLEVKLNQAKANREYQALKEQIAADVQANVVLSDEILETLEEVDALDVSVGPLVQQQQEALANQKKVQESVDARLEALRVDLSRVQTDLKQLESTLSGEFLTEYLRCVPNRKEDAMAEVDGQSCGGCYTILSPQHVDRLRMGKYVICSSCGRMIYTPEGR